MKARSTINQGSEGGGTNGGVSSLDDIARTRCQRVPSGQRRYKVNLVSQQSDTAASHQTNRKGIQKHLHMYSML